MSEPSQTEIESGHEASAFEDSVRLCQEAMPPEVMIEGFAIEHVLLSVTIITGPKNGGRFDDTVEYMIQRELRGRQGVLGFRTKVHYEHTKHETHPMGCQCHLCDSVKQHSPVEAEAQAIYEATMSIDPRTGRKYPWVPGGNSDMQQRARSEARQKLGLEPRTP